MPVRVREKVRVTGTATPSALNAETDLINLGNQTDDYIIEGAIDLGGLASDDSVTIKVYFAVDGVNQRESDSKTFSGVQDCPIVRVLAHTLRYDAKIRVTITQTAGSTIKSFPYYFIYQILETI
jgi:hypothetical protein